MAAKRFSDDYSGHDQEEAPPTKRTNPSFSPHLSMIGMKDREKFLEDFCSILEPILRRVVSEEVEGELKRSIPLMSLNKSPSLRPDSTLTLRFSKKLHLPIFTGTKITDIDNNPLEIFLENLNGHENFVFPPCLTLELVVIEFDFSDGEDRTAACTFDEFERSIVKARNGKRPLLVGELMVSMSNGRAIVGEIELTDNSSWLKTRKFRIGVRVVKGVENGFRVREAITEAFVVKDHRGESYKKHHPPMLHDELWRLEKIGKDGAFHRRLNSAGIKNVQDFLKLYFVDPLQLREILGSKMSDKTWNVIVKQAKTCILDNKVYIYRRNNLVIFLNSICQVMEAIIDDQTFHNIDTSNNLIRSLVTEAYHNWLSLEEYDDQTQGVVGDQITWEHP